MFNFPQDISVHLLCIYISHNKVCMLNKCFQHMQHLWVLSTSFLMERQAKVSHNDKILSFMQVRAHTTVITVLP